MAMIRGNRIRTSIHCSLTGVGGLVKRNRRVKARANPLVFLQELAFVQECAAESGHEAAVR